MAAAATSFDRDDSPREDHIVVLKGTWADYQRLMELRGDRSAPRFTYLEGAIQIMSPSRDHETIKSMLGCLVDECYVFGAPSTRPSRPDLAIEVVWTAGGLDKLDVYRKLGVREVWIWRKGVLKPWVLSGESYEERTTSDALPGLDLAELASFVDRPTTSAAIRAYRDALQQRA